MYRHPRCWWVMHVGGCTENWLTLNREGYSDCLEPGSFALCAGGKATSAAGTTKVISEKESPFGPLPPLLGGGPHRQTQGRNQRGTCPGNRLSGKRPGLGS